MPGVAAIVLAAGTSSRLGFPKQLIKLDGETLLDRAVRLAFEAGLSPIYGVISSGLAHEPMPREMAAVVNNEATEGMASSIRLGVRAVQIVAAPLAGALILACDQPAVTTKHLEELALGGSEILASAYAGKKGIPAYFPTRMFGELLALRGDTGARDLLKNAKFVQLRGGEFDIDTIEDLDRVRKLYGGDTGS
jgi:molybdenum cofactor cytidylyltransferase